MNPFEVTNEIAALLRSYRCTQVTGDDYGKRWVTDAYGQIGITRLKSALDRSGIYLNVLPLFTSGRARLLDNQRLVNQFANLERRTFPSGKDKIDHERGRHDDLCNAAAGALTLASRRQTSIRRSSCRSSALARRTPSPVASSAWLAAATWPRGLVATAAPWMADGSQPQRHLSMQRSGVPPHYLKRADEPWRRYVRGY